MDSVALATLAGDGLLAGGTVAAAALAAKRAKEARDVGHRNAAELAKVKQQTDGRQARLIKRAVEEVAREHPELVAEAVANEVVRTVLESILGTHLETRDTYAPRRREED